MLKFVFVLFSLIIISININAQTSIDRDELIKVFNKQNTDWNDGNIPSFMDGYWKSDSLKFIGKGGIQYGWQNTLENYQKNYPDKATMGTLKFEVENLQFISNEYAFLIGKWHLKRQKKGNLGGSFSLLWKKINGKWLIIVDHTS